MSVCLSWLSLTLTTRPVLLQFEPVWLARVESGYHSDQQHVVHSCRVFGVCIVLVFRYTLGYKPHIWISGGC